MLQKESLTCCVLLLLLLNSCFYREDGDPPSEIWEPYFVNNTSQPFELHVRVLSHESSKIIQIQDTIHRQFAHSYDSTSLDIPTENRECGLFTNNCDPASVTISIRFIEDNLCLRFEGPIVDSTQDLRSWNAYTRIGPIFGYGTFVKGIQYEAIIDSSYLAMAIPCGND